MIDSQAKAHAVELIAQDFHRQRLFVGRNFADAHPEIQAFYRRMAELTYNARMERLGLQPLLRHYDDVFAQPTESPRIKDSEKER